MSPEEQKSQQANTKPEAPNNVYEFYDLTGGAPTPAERATLDQKKAGLRDSYLTTGETTSHTIDLSPLSAEAETPDDLLTDDDLLKQERQKLEDEDSGNTRERSNVFIDFVKTKKGKFVLGGTALLATVGAILGTSLANSAQQTAPKPAATAQPNPQHTEPSTEPSVTPAPEVTPAPNTEVIPDALKPLQAETADQFANESLQTRLTYLSWLTRGDIKTYADEYAATSKNPLDQYPSQVSIDNTPQEILTVSGTNIRFAFSQDNVQEALKATMAGLEHGQASDAYPIWSTEIKKSPLLPFSAKMLAAAGFIISSQYSGESSPVQVNASGEQYRNISWTGSGTDIYGKTVSQSGTTRVNFVKYTDYRGEQASIWLRQ